MAISSSLVLPAASAEGSCTREAYPPGRTPDHGLGVDDFSPAARPGLDRSGLGGGLVSPTPLAFQRNVDASTETIRS